MQLIEKSKTFLEYIENWLDDLPTLTLEDVIPNPEQSVIISNDVINGFLYEGPLSDPRVAKIDEPITRLMKAAWDKGMHHILLVQEEHTEDSPESEAAATDKIQNLPFYSELTTVYKDTIHPALNNDFGPWIRDREPLKTFIAVGDMTDTCIYQLAMHLRTWANAFHKQRRVIVPANCTQTWHLSVGDAKKNSAIPHDGDLLHAVFLYHMALNGIEVVKEIRH